VAASTIRFYSPRYFWQLQYCELRFQESEVSNVEGFRLQELIAPGYQAVQQGNGIELARGDVDSPLRELAVICGKAVAQPCGYAFGQRGSKPGEALAAVTRIFP